MSKIVLVGPAGCGKTHQLLDAFEKALETSPDPLAADMFFIVPSAEHTERVISLLVQRGLKGFFHKRVTTLSRLVNDIFRVTDIPVASSLARNMIVRDLFRENNWNYFSEVQEQPGFLNLVLQFITELKEACISPEVFRERMNVLKGFEPAYATKYEALAGMVEQYAEALRQRGLRDSQDALKIFRERKEKSGVLAAGPRFRSLWIDGFFDFYNLQIEYLRELASFSEKMTLTLTREEGTRHEDVFDSVDETRKSLERIGFRSQNMPARSFRSQNPALLFLQKNLFAQRETGGMSQKGKSPNALEDITLLDAIGTEGEIELIAREIHKLYATGHYRYSDFAVLFRQIKSYAPVLAAIFARYQIPVEIHERDRLKFSSWIATVVSLLSIFRNGWQQEDLFGFLKSGYVRRFGDAGTKDAEWIALFEQRAFQEGVAETRDAWITDWKNRGAKEIPEFHTRKKEILKPFVGLEDQFRAAGSIHEQIEILKTSVYDTFGILRISDDPAMSVRRDAACVRRFESLLDEMRGYFLKGSLKAVPFESFTDYFLGLVELDVYSLHERDKNRVQIYDVSLARQKEYKVVFVAGLLEKVFPMQAREDPLLSDWERKLMNGGMAFPLAERLPRQSLERFLFYLAVTRASEKLYLSYPHFDFEGKESLPSFYLEEVKSLFVDPLSVRCQNLARPYPSLEEAITRHELEIAAVGQLKEVSEKKADVNALLEKVLETLMEDASSQSRILEALKSINAGLVDKRIHEKKYFEMPEASPTRIEEYAKCPYRYFADRILKLRETGEDINVMQKGNILHHVLQQFFDPQRKKLFKENLEDFVRRELEVGFQKYPFIWPEKYREDLDRREIYEMILFFLQEEEQRLEAASFSPYRVEYSFGSKDTCESPALELAGEGKARRIQGRIDRIDVDSEKKFAVVVDYKRSAKFKAGDLAMGTALQLPLYLLAVKEHLGLTPLGAEIYSIKDRKRSGFYSQENAGLFGKEFSSRSQLSEEIFKRVLDRAVAFVRKFVKEIEALEIPVKPRVCEGFCPYDTVCRIEKWKLPLILQEIKEEDQKSGIGQENGSMGQGEKEELA